MSLPYKEWMLKVDAAVQAMTGLSVYDLADFDFWNAWKDGSSPTEVARDLLESEGWEE